MGEKRNKLQANQDEIQMKLNNCKDQKDQLQQDILKQAEIMIKGIRQVRIAFYLFKKILSS